MERQSTHVSWKRMNPRESVWNPLFTEIISMSDFLVNKFIPISQAMKIPDAKAAVDKEWEKLEKLLARQMTKIKIKSGVILEAEQTKTKVHFATLMDSCHLKNAELEPTFQKHKKGSSRAPKRHCKRRFRSICSMYGTRMACFTNDGCKSDGRYCETTWLCRTSRRRSICLHTSKMEDAPKVVEKSRVGVSKKMDTQVAKIFVKHWGPSGSSWTKLLRTPHLLDSCGKDNLRKFYWDLDGKKYRIGNACLFIGNKEYSCQCTWMTSKWLGESRTWHPCGRSWWDLWTSANQHRFLTMYTWDARDVNVNRTTTLSTNTGKCPSYEFLQQPMKNLQGGRNFTQKRSRGPTWKDMRKKCVERYCELANKKTEQVYKV